MLPSRHFLNVEYLRRKEIQNDYWALIRYPVTLASIVALQRESKRAWIIARDIDLHDSLSLSINPPGVTSDRL
jgi:hypothetical protein